MMVERELKPAENVADGALHRLISAARTMAFAEMWMKVNFSELSVMVNRKTLQSLV